MWAYILPKGYNKGFYLGAGVGKHNYRVGARASVLDDFFKEKIEAAQAGWRRVAAAAVINGIPAPAISSALSYFDGYRTARLPANLLQAQRDYFGAHTYERLDKDRGEFFHTNWTGRGGDTSSSTYNA